MPRGKEIGVRKKREIYRVCTEEGLAAALEHGVRCGLMRRTIYRIWASEDGVFNEGVRTGSMPAWSQDQKDALIEHLEAIPTLTLCEMQRWAAGEDFPAVSKQTIATYLDRALITYKLVTMETTARNSPATKSARREFGHWYLGTTVSRLVFIDETGICLWTTRRRGRARMGVAPQARVAAQRESNRSVAMAVSMNIGVVHMEIKTGPFNRESFNAFLGDLCAALHSRDFHDPIFVLDNCRIHSREDLEALRVAFGVEYCFLPPWSPMLNPIESVFADFKREVRTLLGITYLQEIVEIDAGPRGDKGRRRGEVLVRPCHEAARTLNPQTINSHINHVNQAVGRSIRMEDQ